MTPAHIHRLTFTNVRQFEQRTFEFQPGFNLLVGENGAGKTTILRGLLAALGTGQQIGRRPRLEDEDVRLQTSRAEITAIIQLTDRRREAVKLQKELWRPSKRSASRADLPLVLLYSSNEALCSAMKKKRAKRLLGVDRDGYRSSEEFLYALETGGSPGSKASNENLFGNSQSVRRFVGKMLSTFSRDMGDFYWHFEPYDCSIVTIEGAEKRLSPETRKQAQAFAMRRFQEGGGQNRKRPIIWPDQAKVLLTPEGSERKRGGRNLPSLYEVWEGLESSSSADRRLLLNCSLEVKLTPRIMIRRRAGALSLNQLSDGEQRLFSLFVDIARQLSVNHLSDALGKGEAIVLIDEVDVHLHPKWQRRIVPALEDLFPNCQFIATTHSPFVIQATNRQRIIFIDPRNSEGLLGGGNSIEDIAEDIQGVPQPQRSLRSERLSTSAKNYFTLLKMQAKDANLVDASELRAAEIAYREASEPFSSDPAVHAFLKVLATEAKAQ